MNKMMKKYNILLLGSGGREHAMAWKISQSPHTAALYIAPGNAGTMQHGMNVNLAAEDFGGIAKFVEEHHINMLVVGPEAPLVNGIVDFFNAEEKTGNLLVIGPCRQAAMLEGSKDFAKEFMMRYSIPTAEYQSFDTQDFEKGIQFLENLKPPYVLKADGLAAGKGVLICNDLKEAKSGLYEMLLEDKFGAAGRKVVIEEFLGGIELSVFAAVDGRSYKILPEAKDYKRIGEGDTGPNTGGMGSVSPVPFADRHFMGKVEERIVMPTLRGLIQEGLDYRGFIFFGLMNVNGDPFVIEYNARMGDPETESVFPRITSDVVRLFESIALQTLDDYELTTDMQACASVMLVSGGYPDSYQKGKAISGLDQTKGSIIFHAGTSYSEGSGIITSGGRVIAVTAMGVTVEDALEGCYQNATVIDFEGKYYRKDIGNDLLKIKKRPHF